MNGTKVEVQFCFGIYILLVVVVVVLCCGGV